MKAVLAISSLLLSLVVCESIVRLSESSAWSPEKALTRCCEFDSDLGWRLNQKWDRSAPTGNGRRILFLGDSVMYGFKLKPNQSIPAKVSWMTKNVQSHNFGVPGYGTDQELLQYRLHGRKLKPSIVVIGVTLCNDAGNVANSFQYGAAKPRFEVRGDRLIQTHDVGNSRLRLYALDRSIAQANNVEAALDRFVSDASDPQFVAAVRVTVALLQWLIADVKADGATPIVAVFPYRDMYSSKAHEHLLRSSSNQLSGVDVIDFFPHLNESHFIDEYHFNEAGSGIVADALMLKLSTFSF